MTVTIVETLTKGTNAVLMLFEKCPSSSFTQKVPRSNEVGTGAIEVVRRKEDILRLNQLQVFLVLLQCLFLLIVRIKVDKALLPTGVTKV